MKLLLTSPVQITIKGLLLLLAAAAFAARVNYTYDAAGRLVRVEYEGGPSIVYVYDSAGNLLSRTVTAAQPSNAAASTRRLHPHLARRGPAELQRLPVHSQR